MCSVFVERFVHQHLQGAEVYIIVYAWKQSTARTTSATPVNLFLEHLNQLRYVGLTTPCDPQHLRPLQYVTFSEDCSLFANQIQQRIMQLPGSTDPELYCSMSHLPTLEMAERLERILIAALGTCFLKHGGDIAPWR